MVFSIIQKSQLEGAQRLDAEYYQPEYLKLESNLGKNNLSLKFFSDILEKENSLTGGATPLGADYPSSGVRFLRVQNIMQGFLDFDDVVFISQQTNDNQLKRSQLVDSDVLLTITGVSYGKSAVYKKSCGPCNINQHSVRMRFIEKILPEYVATFLNSKYGRFQSDRKITGDTRPALAYEEIKNYLIPIFDIEQQKNIQKIYTKANNLLDESENIYKNALDIFLSETNVNWFSENKIYYSVVNLFEVQTVNRFDAEYFNSPCNKILTQIIKGKTAKLGDLADMTKGVEPGADAYQDEGKLFIRVSSISKDGIIDKDQKYLSDDLYNEYKKDYQPQVGDVLLTKDASIGVACVVRESVEGIVAGGVLRLKLKEKMNPEYLALVLNSIVGQMQAKRDAGGSIIAHWKPEQIKNLVVPILPAATQEKIAGLIVKSHEARKKAKRLLEEAKLKVEEMIEKGGR
ncbi:MAG: restriction endonuclease subunit S [Candidatus Magasanikbacteria bacterium]|jgi:restriction endonuclease S subunit